LAYKLKETTNISQPGDHSAASVKEKKIKHKNTNIYFKIFLDLQVFA